MRLCSVDGAMHTTIRDSYSDHLSFEQALIQRRHANELEELNYANLIADGVDTATSVQEFESLEEEIDSVAEEEDNESVSTNSGFDEVIEELPTRQRTRNTRRQRAEEAKVFSDCADSQQSLKRQKVEENIEFS